MRRNRITYVLSFPVVTVIGFVLGLGLVPDDWSGGADREGQVVQVYYFQNQFVRRTMLSSGWSQPENWGTWSEGSKSKLAIDLDEPHRGDIELKFLLQAFFGGGHRSQRVELSVNGTKVDTWMLDPSRAEWLKRVRIASDIWDAKRPVDIAFAYSQPKSAAELGIGKDSRRLAIGLKTLTIRELF